MWGQDNGCGGGDPWGQKGGAAASGGGAKGGGWLLPPIQGAGGSKGGGGGKLGPGGGGGGKGGGYGGKGGGYDGGYGGKDAGYGGGGKGGGGYDGGYGGKDAGYGGKGGGKNDGYGAAPAWGKGGGGKGKDAGKGKGGGMKGPYGDAGGWGGGAPPGADDWLPGQSAYVKTWNEERGFGFVTIASGEDIYVHRTTLTDGDVLAKDANVWVEAQWDWEKSKWKSTICSGASGKGGAPPPMGKGGKGGKGGKDGGKGKGGYGGKGGKGQRGAEWMQGIGAHVKAWTEERGFGFVSTPEGEDVYVHRTALTDGTALVLQAEVYVDATWNWEKNKWHATRVTGAAGESPKNAGLDQPIATGVQSGVVKAWQAKGGFGFIVPDNGGPDVFVHQSALTEGVPGLTVGEGVNFDLQHEERKNKFLAVSCTPDGTMRGVPEAGGKGYQGTKMGAEGDLAAQLEAVGGLM